MRDPPFQGGLPEKRAQFFLGRYDLHRNYGMVVILLSFLCNCDNLTRKPEMSVALEASKQSIEIHHEYDARPLIKSYNCY